MTLPLSAEDPRIHVFSLEEEAPKLPTRTYLTPSSQTPDPAPLRAAFGAEIDPTYVEIFPVADVAPMGLRAYLAQAHDIPETAFEADRTRLDALTRTVAVLSPRAVVGLEALEPAKGLVHVGSYAPVEADDAPGNLQARGPRPPVDTPQRSTGRSLSRSTIAWVVLIGLILAGIVVLWL